MTAVDQAVQVMDQAKREILTLRADNTDLLTALKDVMAGTYSPSQHEGCTDCNFKRALKVIARVEANP